MLERLLQLSLENRQRSPQFVSGIGGEAARLLEARFQPLQHRVEHLDEPLKLGVVPHHR